MTTLWLLRAGVLLALILAGKWGIVPVVICGLAYLCGCLDGEIGTKREVKRILIEEGLWEDPTASK